MTSACFMFVRFLSLGTTLLSGPSLGLVEHGEVAADFQVVAVEPDKNWGLLITFCFSHPQDTNSCQFLANPRETGFGQYVNVVRFFVF